MERLNRPFDILCADPVVGDHPEAGRPCMMQQHFLFPEACYEFVIRESLIDKIEEEDVRSDVVQLYSQSPDSGNCFGKATGVCMVFRKTFDHLFQRDDPRSGNDSGLTHSTTQHFPDPAGTRDECSVPADQGTYWRGKPL